MEAENKLKFMKIPPVLDDLDDELRDFLLNPERLSIHDWQRSQVHWPRTPDVQSLFCYKEIPFQSSVKPVRNHLNETVGWKEEINPRGLGREDVTMKRPPLPASLATQGVATQLPFLPAGFEDEQAQMKILQKPKSEENFEFGEPGTFLGEKLLFIAPTFTSGLMFTPDGRTLYGETPTKDGDGNISDADRGDDMPDGVDTIQTVIDEENHLVGLWTDSDDMVLDTLSAEKEVSSTKAGDRQGSLFDECFSGVLEGPPDLPVLKISDDMRPAFKAHETEWAEILDVTKPVEDFHKRIPNMAHNFPFELDTFQKQAILKLEEQGHVFVSAHTSAGKTVVAEYAIALSKKHCTRTVYTSPIKALSNQKYQDFSRTFGDVGLMTGDLQINTTAGCLVMTTEILRSMLYHGSDVVRDLEYVIFDEVHYINNVERGYVWEEVLILLPPHVSIVMLSATVPNSLEFADWVGRTKKRKVYVVSTQKRPVPLCHYLYTGSSGSSKDNLFPIIDQDGNYLQSGFDSAVASKKATMSKYSQNFGAKGPRNHLNPNQEKTMWVAFIDHLRTHNKLPVVAFVLSRNRCDKIAVALQSIDLTTAKEKARIDFFIQGCLKRLKEPDRQLPQVLKMKSLLACGIGIHHSGILPILKEIVEMLFQTGAVKILFATETFAMGVNMPARTVIFDSIMKFDGLEMRPLLPAEYIQMAGRAGRRGLDDTGAVIILCKKDVPDSMTLKAMMQGKPMRLSSQFRVTYATMLSLLRATSVSIEGMMRRSFREFGVQSKADAYKKELEELQEKISQLEDNPISPHLSMLAEFHDVASDYIQEMNDVMPFLLEQQINIKYLTPGRIFLIVCGKYVNQLAYYINFQGPRMTPYKVLVLDREDLDYSPPSSTENLEIWYSLMSLAVGTDRVGSDVATLKHSVLCIGAKNIIGITTFGINTNAQIVLQDYEQRQLLRFRANPPGNTCKQTLIKLAELSYSLHSGQKRLEFVNLKAGLRINTGEILDSIRRCDVLQERLAVLRRSTNIANFAEEFEKVFEQRQLLRKYNNLKKILSYEAMALYPDYQQRLKVLKELRYIDDQNCVAMKGRVACEMKTNELIITELVFRNIFTDLEPAKIAALLSCLVFQAHTNSEQVIDDSLKESIEAIRAVDEDLSMVEKKYMVGADDPCLERLNFGLVQVVYDWAKGKPFAEIANLTDVHEGIIVRNIQQLHEVLTNVRDAAKIIGDPLLQSKMEEVSGSIKRDIVFFASLYTQGDIFTDVS